MSRISLVLLLAGAVAACDRNPEGSSSSRNLSSGEPAAEGTGMPPGHPPVDPSGMPPDHPPMGSELPEGHPPVGGGEPGAPSAGGLTWTAPDAFEAQPVASSMRAAEYAVSGEGTGQPATLVVYYFGPGQGGDVQANVDRWVGQFNPPKGKKPKTEKRQAHGLPVTVVEAMGTYTPMQLPGQPATGPEPDQQLLGAIVEGPQGPVFFKLVGPSAVVAKAKPAFDDLIASIRPT